MKFKLVLLSHLRVPYFFKLNPLKLLPTRFCFDEEVYDVKMK